MPPAVMERTSVQIIAVISLLALFANSTTSHTDEGLPWEVTIGSFCTILVIFLAHYTQRTEVGLGIIRCACPRLLLQFWRSRAPHRRAAAS